MNSIGRRERRTGRLAVTLAAALAWTALTAAEAHAQAQPVYFGDTIDSPGFYFLAGNQSGSGTGISICSDDVVLYLSRHTLEGDGEDESSGISVSGYSRITIIGGRITNFAEGIELSDVEEVYVRGTRIDHCTEAGVDGDAVYGSRFHGLETDHNGEDGVQIESSSMNELIRINSHHNGDDGIDIAIDDDLMMIPTANLISDCRSYWNGGHGIVIDGGNENDLIGNSCHQNMGHGIAVHAQAPAGSTPMGGDENFLKLNHCNFNGMRGINLSVFTGGNEVIYNKALANPEGDLADNTMPDSGCANEWHDNLYGSAVGNGAVCID